MRPVTVSSPSLASQQTPQSSSSTFRPQQRPQVSQPRPQQSQLVTPPQQNTILTQQQQQQKQQQSASHQNQQIAAPKNQPQLSQHPTARTPISMTPKPDLPAIQNVAVLQSVDTAATDANASETGTRLLTKRSIHELVAQVCCYFLFSNMGMLLLLQCILKGRWSAFFPLLFFLHINHFISSHRRLLRSVKCSSGPLWFPQSILQVHLLLVLYSGCGSHSNNWACFFWRK
jgi:predicted RND superfamily exporter protein